ncbi:hypothetical protein PAT3040_05693 [Paenibacillus agaridevorans]|uniref:Uncharacterized protein n=1 Tax=Paenibacillus agaridevorans TaxID=171404 RepID=A0A2R5F3C9_9BACL|nr:hypothetical protein PAT3040_05693 [Paenibacillus agaridevorans]
MIGKAAPHELPLEVGFAFGGRAVADHVRAAHDHDLRSPNFHPGFDVIRPNAKFAPDPVHLRSKHGLLDRRIIARSCKQQGDKRYEYDKNQTFGSKRHLIHSNHPPSESASEISIIVKPFNLSCRVINRSLRNTLSAIVVFILTLEASDMNSG